MGDPRDGFTLTEGGRTRGSDYSKETRLDLLEKRLEEVELRTEKAKKKSKNKGRK